MEGGYPSKVASFFLSPKLCPGGGIYYQLCDPPFIPAHTSPHYDIISKFSSPGKHARRSYRYASFRRSRY